MRALPSHRGAEVSLLTGGAYGVSALLIVYAIGAEIAPEELRFPLLIAWAAAGGARIGQE